MEIDQFPSADPLPGEIHYNCNTLWSAIEQNDSRFSIIFISYFNEKDGGRWETYCLYGVEGDGILSIL